METALHQPHEVADRLRQLGLTPDILRTAVMVGEAARLSCTANDPPGFAGYIAWGSTIRTLRELLAPLGWKKNDDGNYSTVVDEQEAIAIAVASGDENTGSLGISPRTKNAKGPATIAAIDANVRQLAFPFRDQRPVQIQPRRTQRVTWILLISRFDNEVRFELSLPTATGDDDRVESWQERIILDSIPIDPPPVAQLDPGPEIEVEVHRRAG